jgi:Ras-related GTP-binding protein C/D
MATDSTPVEKEYYELCSDMIDVVLDVTSIYGYSDYSDKQFDQNSQAIFPLENDKVLYLREVNRFMALVCILKKETYSKIGLIDFNFMQFQKALWSLFDANEKQKKKIKKK